MVGFVGSAKDSGTGSYSIGGLLKSFAGGTVRFAL